MEREQAQPSVGKEVQTQTTDTKEKADKNSNIPKVKTIISGGYRGPYPRPKKLNHQGYKRHRTKISDNEVTNVTYK